MRWPIVNSLPCKMFWPLFTREQGTHYERMPAYKPMARDTGHLSHGEGTHGPPPHRWGTAPYTHVMRGAALAYRGLILDFGGVLTTRMRLNGEAFEKSEGLPPGAYFHALNKHPEGVRVYADLEVGQATQEEWNQVIGGILGIDPTDLMRRALANLRPEAAVVAATERARQAGIKVAMLSNSFGLEPFNVYRELGMQEGFDVVMLSEQERVRKPSPAIYQRTLDALELTGPECVFVDDHAENLPPAEALGILAIHHTDPMATAAQLDALLAPSAV